MNAPVTRVRGLVRGSVQGAGFRYWCQQEAERLGLSGWVKNLVDGRVEFEVQGPPESVGSFTDLVHEGPRTARVQSVHLSEREVQDEGRGGLRIVG